jgi:hypothetical protein
MLRLDRVLAACCLVLGASGAALADKTPKAPPPVATLPKAGDALPLAGAAEWPKLQWVYAPPATNDAAGKVVIHWFCTAKVAACTDDLARIVTLRDTGKVYIVAYVDGSTRDAKKIDPIRESEGVGRGTLAFGKGVTTLMKQMKLAPGPASIVVGLDGKVAAVTTSGDVNELDARDSVVNTAIAAIKEYTTSQDGPTTAKPGEKFALTLKIQLASWLAYSKKTPMEFTLSVPKDIKCDATTLKGDQLKIDAQTLTATASCAAPKGSYEVRGDIRFGYDSPGGGTGLGTDGGKWKFEIK